MCRICADLSLGRLTVKEALNNLLEVDPNKDEHYFTAAYKILDQLAESERSKIKFEGNE